MDPVYLFIDRGNKSGKWMKVEKTNTRTGNRSPMDNPLHIFNQDVSNRKDE